LLRILEIKGADKRMVEGYETEIDKRVRHFVQIEFSEEEKQELKNFAEGKGLKLSVFARQCLNFFKTRNVTPVEFAPEQQISFDLSNIPDLSNVFGVVVNPILKEISKIGDRIASIEEKVSNLNVEIKNTQEDVTLEVSEYISKVSEEIRSLKEKITKRE
jgi:hypothetical protein